LYYNKKKRKKSLDLVKFITALIGIFLLHVVRTCYYQERNIANMDQKKLLEEFEMLRKEMNKLGKIFGLDNKKVLELSRKIDKIHNELSKIQKNK